MFIGRTDVEAETPILWPPDVKSWLIWKDPDAGKDWRWEEKGMTEDEMTGWHHWFNGHGFGWTPGVGDGQRSLACCNSWGRRVGHDWVTELNWTEAWKQCKENQEEINVRFKLYMKSFSGVKIKIITLKIHIHADSTVFNVWKLLSWINKSK